MADPTKFTPGYSYTNWQASNPTLPLPANRADQDMANIAMSIDQTIEALKNVRRSDGKLPNGIVTIDSLDAQVSAGVGAGALASATEAHFWAQVALGAATGALPAGSVTEEKLSAALAEKINGRAILIFAVGQSNMARYEPFTWTPPANLRLWNHDPMVDAVTHVGTAFEDVPSDNISLSWSFGAEIAAANPDKTVYIVNASRGGQPIDSWLPGAATDLYACGKSNIEAALAVIDAPVKLIHLWWQGEYDASVGNTGYIADFIAYRTRLVAETWWPRETPIALFGLSAYMSGTEGDKQRAFNGVLSQLAAYDPERFTYIHTSALGQSYAWLPTAGSDSYIHMTAAGYASAGSMAYNVLFAGAGRATLDTLYVDPLTKQLAQPGKYAFLANTTSPDTSGTVTDYTTIYETVGSYFDPATGVFTVPISGLWCFENLLNVNNLACAMQLHKNGSNAGASSSMIAQSGLGELTNQNSITLPLAKGDLMKLVITSGTSNVIRFSGRFVG